MSPLELYRQAQSLGIRLEPRGPNKLAVIPADRVPPDLADLLRHHEVELLAWLADVPSAEEFMAAFDGQVVARFKPGDPVPNQFGDVLHDWPAIGGQFNLTPPSPKAVGRRLGGTPVTESDLRHEDTRSWATMTQEQKNEWARRFKRRVLTPLLVDIDPPCLPGRQETTIQPDGTITKREFELAALEAMKATRDYDKWRDDLRGT
jgi:hypothetical protein